MVRMGPSSCFACQRQGNITERLAAISLSELVEGLGAPIRRLHMDAQGTDFHLIRSLGRMLDRVTELKLECQLIKYSTNGLMYLDSPVPNNCEAARDYLMGMGFGQVRLQMNNCGCEEYVLWACRSPSARCGRKKEREWTWV